MTSSLNRNKLVLLKNTYFQKNKSCMKVVRQLNLKKKEKTGDRGVIPTNPYNAFWVLIPIYFTLRNVKIHETVASCRKKKRFVAVNKSLISRANIYILE